MRTQLWMTVVVLAVLHTLTARAGVYYSPVFNMPLQPAPSACNGNFYWVMPDGRTFGPNFNLRPPFTPITGFDNTFVGQALFSKMYEDACKGTGGPGPGKGPNPPNPGQKPKTGKGLGGYNLDYSDPNTWQNFDATAPMPNGYVPFTDRPGPGGNNGAQQYPNYPANPGPSGYQPPPRGMAQASYAPVYQAGYSLGWGNPIQPVQWQTYPTAYNPYPYAPGMTANTSWYQGGTAAPHFGYQGYNYPAPAYSYGQQGYYRPSYYGPPSLPCPPGYAMPNPYLPMYSMPAPRFPNSPNYSMPGLCYPNLPNPSYEPPCPEPSCQPLYYQNPLARSPRDFFMWKEAKEDREELERNPLSLPR